MTLQFASIVDGSLYRLSPADNSETGLYDRVGESAALAELCRAMVQHSSNLATNLLIQRLGVKRTRSTTQVLKAPGMRVLRAWRTQGLLRRPQQQHDRPSPAAAARVDRPS